MYQPIVSVTTGVVVGYESLARFASGEPPDLVLSRLRQGGAGALAMEIACVRAALSAGPPPDGALPVGRR